MGHSMRGSDIQKHGWAIDGNESVSEIIELVKSIDDSFEKLHEHIQDLTQILPTYLNEMEERFCVLEKLVRDSRVSNG